MKNLIVLVLLLFSNSIVISQSVWESSIFSATARWNDVCFVNANTGFATGYEGDYNVVVYKTVNKGRNWSLIHIFSANISESKNASIYFISPSLGFLSYQNKIIKLEGTSETTVLTYPHHSATHRIKFVNETTGYALFSHKNDILNNNVSYVSIYKTVNGGNSWNTTSAYQIQTMNGADRQSYIMDLDFSKSNPNIIHAVGYYDNGAFGTSIDIRTSDGFSSRSVDGDAVSGSRFGHVQIMNDEVRILGNKGLKINTHGINSYTTRYQFSSPNAHPEFGMHFLNEDTGYIALHNGNLVKTTNGGLNWNNDFIISSTNIITSSRICSIGDIVYYTSPSNRDLYTRRLETNLFTFFDNQSELNSFFFDESESYPTPSEQNLRGGNSKLSISTNKILNPNQTNEKLFYKWSDGNMDSSNTNFYFDKIGTTISNYYKSKQISTTSNAIANVGQAKTLKDGWGAINQLHQSLDGGIFYTKSYNNGITYKREEIVNLNTGLGNGNKNPSICEIQWQQNINIDYPVNKNVVVCWERFNSTTNKTELYASVRNDTTNPLYAWMNWSHYPSGSKIFSEFVSSSNFNSKPQVFTFNKNALSSGFGDPNSYFFVIPHLRPHSSGAKLTVASRLGNHASEIFDLDSGDIADFSVVSSPTVGSAWNLDLHFSYRKGSQIVYRKTSFSFSEVTLGHYGIYRNPLEGPTNVSSGDGAFSTRLTPTISLMYKENSGYVPVIAYAANYNAWRTIQYEDNSTSSILVNRYPIVKVQRHNTSNSWGNYVIYNSGNIQSNPEIEGNRNKLSYILNYSQGNGSFKKVANIEGSGGFNIIPNLFSGTDARLVKNSFSGDLGGNMTMLTLSPQSSVYKLDKQDFVISNITAQDSYDISALDGVINLDTINYSFRLGPIFTENPFDPEDPVGPEPTPPIYTGIEFNENLKSYPFKLVENQALILGANASFHKANDFYSIQEIPYTVNLYNKTTGLLHRTLFEDTIKAGDSVESESLRGFYITDVPNYEDTFYVKLEVDEEFDNAEYFVNPIYEDEYDDEEDFMGNGRLAVIFEDQNFQNQSFPLPTEYSLSQNFPNPFNPSTKISFALPNDGLAKVSVFDVAGKEIAVLVNESKQAGNYEVIFNASNFASGVYFYRIQAGDFVQTKRMVLIK